jgi:hypothetical protein
LKRNKSPNTKPTNPEMVSHFQFSTEASNGRIMPRFIERKMVRKMKPITSLITLTESEPTFKLADSKARAVIVQNIAVARAASSPL